jgi:hypothetical protein
MRCQHYRGVAEALIFGNLGGFENPRINVIAFQAPECPIFKTFIAGCHAHYFHLCRAFWASGHQVHVGNEPDSAFEFWHCCSLSQAGALANSQPPTPDTGSLSVMDIKLFEDVIVPEMIRTNQNRPSSTAKRSFDKKPLGATRLPTIPVRQ